MANTLKNIQQEENDAAVVVALGSSLAGDFESRQALLDKAKNAFPASGMVVRKVSRWWASKAWPDPSQPGYLNGVAIVETALTPDQVLAALTQIETRFGRRRDGANAPRTLDLDLIAHGRRVIDQPNLIVPHPRAHERRFVMGPLAEIAPDWRHPITNQTATALAQSAAIGADATPDWRPAA
jgi:2-amino-4-hydroxy-6-hydroxymethyldihydropteridine diphosphokinase